MASNGLKYLLGVLIVAAVSIKVCGQPHGNEWIRPGQTYYKLKVAQRGIFRLTYQQLIESGVPLASIDARRLQLFHRGVEQAIHVPGQDDGRLDAGDYIDFYGEPTDGAADTELYLSPEAQPHTLYNLFSDSATYFITWPLVDSRGKRMVSSIAESNVDNLPAEPYHVREVLHLQTNNYSQGRTYSEGDVILSQYDYGEGWTGSDIAKGGNQAITLTGLSNRVTSGPNPIIEVSLVGRNNLEHNVEIYAGASAASVRLIQTVQFSEHDPYLLNQEINWSDISAAGELVVRVNVVGFPNAADRAAISYIRVWYPSATDMAGAGQYFLQLRANGGGRSLLRVTNPPGPVDLFDITQKEDSRKIGIISAAGNFSAIVNNTTTSRQILASAVPLVVSKIERVDIPTYDPTAFNYVIISHPALRTVTSSGLLDPVAAYKSYRESATGGSYKVLVLEMAQVYDMFNYGEISPWAIRRVGSYMLAHGNPEYFFLIGKGTGVHRNYYRQDPATTTIVHFVPTNGVPGSDIAMLAGLGGTTYDSPIAIGRLNARTPDDVEAYLNKVREMEAVPFDALWRKNFVHLSGGATQGELAIFKSYVDGFKSIATGKYLGAQVVTSSKSTSNAVELINIAEEINSGVSMVTFFGHSASFSTDIDIGTVSNPGFGYSNKGKYPVILVNGCDAGNIFETAFTFGEDWMLTPDLGAIGFMAHSYKGLSSDLRSFSNVFYQTAFADTVFINQTLGKVKNKASTRYLERYGNSEKNITQVQEVVLQGDPAIRIFGAGKPDYQTNADQIEAVDIDGSPLKVAKDTFALRVVVRNYGIGKEKNLDILMRRRLENGEVIDQSYSLPSPLREDTMYLGVSNPDQLGLGSTTFEVQLDPDNRFDELSETNNTASIDVFLAKGTTIPIFPMKDGIAGTTVDLVIQTADLLSGRRNFEMELDSVPTFNSPYKKQITGEIKVVSVQNVQLEETDVLPDSTGIYWRSRFVNPEAEEDTSWVESRFTVIKNHPDGFTILDPHQFADTEITGMQFSETAFSWAFPENNTPISIRTFGASNPGTAAKEYSVVAGTLELFLENTNFNVCRNNTLNVVVFDKQSTSPYAPISGWQVFNNANTCGLNPKRIHNFTDVEIYNPTVVNGGVRRLSQLLDAIQEGDFVAFFNMGMVQYSRWDAEVKEKLKNFGIQTSTLNSLVDGQPVIFFGRKGSAEGTATELKSNGTTTPLADQELVLSDVVEGRFSNGSVTSGRIGPAKSWGSLYQKVDLGVAQTTANFSMDVYGIGANGDKDLIYSGITDPFLDLSQESAQSYPYMQIEFKTSDENTLVPAQLKKWLLTFDQVPEGILLTSEPAARSGQPVSKFEGQELEIPFSFYNVSPVGFSDSLTVNFQLFAKLTNSTHSSQLKLPPLLAGDSIQFVFNANTIGKEGLSDLRTTVAATETEISMNNNRLSFPDFVDVNADDVNPLLDVTFDGLYILDGDIVSPDPIVRMRLVDNNEYLFKQDTIGIEVSLKVDCEECNYERAPFSGGKITWAPNTEKKEFNMEYRPGPLEDGIYTMRVIASDASGNQAGTAPYEISFEVINESAITNFYPYPNPFSSNTRFVFTLTGGEVPDQFKIQIMSVSGRIVREITQDEIGPLRIGNNITTYAWDGTDEFGDQLANGVYLYRVLIRSNGQAMEQRATAADKAFKNGFGKLYILR